MSELYLTEALRAAMDDALERDASVMLMGEDIGAYGGGQWELGVGREQIQYLAALFHPDTPNDVAPRGYNADEPDPGLPISPMEVASIGFGIPN